MQPKAENLFIFSLILSILLLSQSALSQTRTFTKIQRFRAPEAHQGVAVGPDFVYPVTNRAIEKYAKESGEHLDTFVWPKDGPVIHMDSGVIHDGKLYASHSNYNDLPMASSVEIHHAETLKHIGTHSFGIAWGSCTWIDRYDGAWWAVFANYSRVFGPGSEPYGNSYYTTLVKFDDNWQKQEAWLFPDEVIEQAVPMSISGGSWGPDGYLYCTGHDSTEIYVFQIPEAGSYLELIEEVPLNVHGQGIAWDRSRPGILYGINRPTREVVVFRMEKSDR